MNGHFSVSMIPPLPANAVHPWPSGHVFQSPGAHLTYRIVGPCCRLYDREQLPWPCCRLQWRSKEPSWRRIGRRFVPDMATRRFPSYNVEILGHGYQRGEALVITLYIDKLSPDEQNWWYTKRISPPHPAPMSSTSAAEPAAIPPGYESAADANSHTGDGGAIAAPGNRKPKGNMPQSTL